MREDLRAASWVRTLQDLVAALPGLVSARLELLVLELQRARRGLLQILALAVATAVLGMAAWLVLCTGLGLALLALGWSWPLALLAVLLVNLVLAWAAVSQVRRLLDSLGLPVTRRHLVFGAEAVASTGVPSHRRPLPSGSDNNA